MTRPKIQYRQSPNPRGALLREDGVENGIIGKLQNLNYEYRDDIQDWCKNTFLGVNQRRTNPDYADKKLKHHGLIQAFVDDILNRMIFDGEHLSDLMAPLDLSWKDHTRAELALMADLHPRLIKRAQGREIWGLNTYE